MRTRLNLRGEDEGGRGRRCDGGEGVYAKVGPARDGRSAAANIMAPSQSFWFSLPHHYERLSHPGGRGVGLPDEKCMAQALGLQILLEERERERENSGVELGSDQRAALVW